ncbi:hypothetical protein AAG906_009738 [Vitis piasezkii]
MESTTVIKKFHEPPKDLTRTRLMTIVLGVFLTLPALILFASFLNEEGDQELVRSSTQPQPLHPLIKNACTNTLYPSLCFTTLSSAPATSKNTTTLHHILEIAVNATVSSVMDSGSDIKALFTYQDLNSQEKNALNDCMEMTDQTLYELGQAIDNLHAFPPSIGDPHRLYTNLKTLLSAAMTNENTCIDGFTDLEEADSESQKGLKGHLQSVLTPISGMISNCLAIIKPDIVVASDGSGHFSTIGEAISTAPNKSSNRFVIKIKAGVYKENVEIPREKVNIMLVGDGMNSTVITGSKSFVDGFSTFTSATLTVVGDKFLARDLTIINTAGPEKHQAVAVRVTSNSAFYRCNFSTIDFIFGNAAAVFQNCLILVRKPSPGQKNMITAQGRGDPNQNTGISLQNCTITKLLTFLGRPWRNYSRTMVMKSYLGDLINPQGWYKWNKYSTLDTVEYIEYLNFGPGSDTRHRVTWGGYRKNCSEDIAKQFTAEVFLHGASEWLESIGFPLVHGS